MSYNKLKKSSKNDILRKTKGVMKMTHQQSLIIIIIIFAVTFRYLYKNRIIYQKEFIKQEEREKKQRKRKYKKYQRKITKAEKREQKKMIKNEKKIRKKMIKTRGQDKTNIHIEKAWKKLK